MPGETLNHVPIFPLNTVLFPHMPIPLHIFEERYRAMIADIKDADRRFCVALIAEGQEVGGTAVAHSVGCLAQIMHLQRLDGGRYVLLATGTERVRILSVDSALKPYLTGNIKIWPDEPSQPSVALVKRASTLFMQYALQVMKQDGSTEEQLAIPSDAGTLSCVIGATLHISMETRQQLLGLSCVEERLKAEVAILETEIPLMRALGTTQQSPSGGQVRFSSN